MGLTPIFIFDIIVFTLRPFCACARLRDELAAVPATGRENSIQQTRNGGKLMFKRVFTLFLAAVMLLGFAPEAIVHALDSDWSVSAMFKPDPMATPEVWSQSGTTAESLAGHTFFIDMLVQNSSGQPQSETFTLTGSNLETISLSNFNAGPRGFTFPTSIRCEMNDIYCLLIIPRSGLGIRQYSRLGNTVACINADYYYSGNEGDILINLRSDIPSNPPYHVSVGDAVCQGIFVQYGVTDDDDATELTREQRRGGLGSTGK